MKNITLSKPDKTGKPDFLLGLMCDDLVELSVQMCGTKQDKCTRFPKYLYPTYVDRILKTALDIQSNVFIANGCQIGEYRLGLQKDAVAKCTYLNHLIRISAHNGWISEKQRDRWQSLCTKTGYKILNWYKSDMKRI